MTTALAIIIFVLAAIYCSLVHAREEKSAIQEGKVSAKHIGRIKRKISLLSIITDDKTLTPHILFSAVIILSAACCFFILATLPFVLGSGAKFNTYPGMIYLGIIVAIVGLPLLYGQIQGFCKRQSHYLKNKLWFFENLYAAQRDGCDLNVARPVLEYDLQRRNEVVPELVRHEMASLWNGAPWR